MLKIQMLEQIMNNENSDDECEKSHVEPVEENEATVDYFTRRRSPSKRWVEHSRAT